MINKRVLIIKQDTDSFEQFFSNNMKRKNVDVMPMYRETKSFFQKVIRHYAKRSRWNSFIKSWMGTWKENVDKYDVIIVFDKGCTVELLHAIRKLAPNSELVFWLWNIPKYDIAKHKKIVDQICCFDQSFASANSIHYVHQFHFPELLKKYIAEQDRGSLFFVGTNKNRGSIINSIAQFCHDTGIDYDFNIYSPRDDNNQDVFEKIKIINEFMPYEEVLKRSGSAKAIVEIVKPGQRGLTLRSLEALYLGKKLITNNIAIKSYSVFDENNVFVISDDSIFSLNNFLMKPIVPCSEKLLQSYSYEDWLTKITHL